MLLEYRSNTIAGNSATSVFSFSNDLNSRNGLSSFAPALKWQPLENIGNFSLQSAFHKPLIENESDVNEVFLDILHTCFKIDFSMIILYQVENGNYLQN
ncbi:hypothetical protein [Polaribacter marinivivus]|uniref:hypothetical protein n=1 Tax=Polaribacter marinivivus TaxID=1524260 RepID=UPI003D33E104